MRKMYFVKLRINSNKIKKNIPNVVLIASHTKNKSITEFILLLGLNSFYYSLLEPDSFSYNNE